MKTRDVHSSEVPGSGINGTNHSRAHPERGGTRALSPRLAKGDPNTLKRAGEKVRDRAKGSNAAKFCGIGRQDGEEELTSSQIKEGNRARLPKPQPRRNGSSRT